jgi:hypothetical protein
MSDTSKESLTSVKIHQGYNMNVKVNIVPSSSLPSANPGLKAHCQPRTGAPRRDAEALDLPAETVNKLMNANKALMSWLAQDTANVHAFISNPILALAKAGVQLEKAELNAITRLRGELGSNETVTPGMQLREFKFAASPNGKVKHVEGAHGDCGCNTKRKGI